MVLGPLLLALFVQAPPADGTDELTFTKDIAPILWEHCATCHRPGEVAPFSLLDYKDVVSRARQIATAVANRTMPPWLPAPGSGRFAGERRLAPADIARIETWVRQGARQGDPADLPPTPTWPDRWQLGPPDLVVQVPDAYQLRPGTADVFRTFVMPIPITSTRWVRGFEIRPGNRQVVHHASIAIDPTRESRRLDEADPEPGFGGGMLSGNTHSPGSRALGWTPGMTPAFEPPGMAWRLDPGTDLVILLHLLPPRSGPAVPVPLSVGFYFTDTPPQRMPLDFKLGSKSIDIPAGDPSYTVEDRYVLPADADLLSIYPHAHYLAKQMRVTATLPDGATEPLLWIPRWDFQWQDQYRYATPVSLPAGTTLTMRYTYDNSAGNRSNPHRPPQRVRYGPKSSDEMGDLWLRLLPKTPAGAAAIAQSYRVNELRKDIEATEHLLAERPDDAALSASLGALYLEAGRVADGTARLEDALRRSPDLADAHNNLGHALTLQGRPGEALQHFREAARLAPDNDLVLENLAGALLDAGQAEEALGYLERVVALVPDSAQVHNDLGIALGSTGRLDEAERQFEQALSLQPDFRDARANLEMLRQLKAAQAR